MLNVFSQNAVTLFHLLIAEISCETCELAPTEEMFLTVVKSGNMLGASSQREMIVQKWEFYWITRVFRSARFSTYLQLLKTRMGKV